MQNEKEVQPTAVEDDYPLKETAALLNTRLRLFLSPGQQRGLAAGLMIGIALGAAVVAWSLVAGIRGRLRGPGRG